MRYILTLVFIFLLVPSVSAWDFAKHSIPVDEIIAGGPPKDGIPALMNPEYVSAGDASFMSDKEQVIGVYYKGEPRAYPLRIMSWHELVNDKIGDLPVLVSW